MSIAKKVEELKSTLASSSPLTGLLNQSFLPENEIAKKILLNRNPNLSKSDADLMIDGSRSNPIPTGLTGPGAIGAAGSVGLTELPTSTGAIGAAGNVASIIQQLKNVPGPATIYSAQNKSDSAGTNFPLPQTSPYLIEAKNMKGRITVCVTMLSSMQISLLQELIRVAIQIGTSIAGIAIMVAPMSFNVPGAISHLLLIVDQLSNICKTILSCMPFLDCLSLLDFVIDNVPSNPVVVGLEVVITFLLSIYKLCSILKEFIDKLFGSLNKKINCEKEKRKYNRKKRKLIKEIRELLKDEGFGGTPYSLIPSEKDENYFTQLEDKLRLLLKDGEISEDGADDARDIQDEIKSFDDRIKIICDFTIPETQNGEIDLDKVDLDNEVFQSIRNIKGVTDAIAVGREKYVYDAELPDGTVLKDLTLEEIKELQEKFDIIFKTNENLN
jgi:hypothetical protein